MSRAAAVVGANGEGKEKEGGRASLAGARDGASKAEGGGA
jgi:hypothetical protein